MREVFHQSLEDVQDRLVEISELVTTAIEKATRAFGTSDVALAEEVIESDAVIDEKAIALDELAIEILARQQPVARDLPQLRPGLHFSTGRDEGRRFDGPGQVARDHAVERRPVEEGRGRRRLSTSLGRQRDVVGGDGPAVAVEVGNGTVAHQVDPAPLHGR